MMRSASSIISASSADRRSFGKPAKNRPAATLFPAVPDAGIAALAEVRAKHFITFENLHLELLLELLVERLERDHVEYVFLARDEDRAVLDFAHPEADEIGDRIIVGLAGPSRDVAIARRVGQSVKQAKIERARASLLLLHDNLRGEKFRAAFARLRDQLVDVGGFVAFMLAQLLDVLGEGDELDQPGVAERDSVLGGSRRDPGEI